MTEAPRAPARLIEALDPLLAVLGDATQDAFLGDAQAPHDWGLGTRALAAERGGKHAEGPLIVLSMAEDGLDPAEIRPLRAFADHADHVIDGSGPSGDDRYTEAPIRQDKQARIRCADAYSSTTFPRRTPLCVHKSLKNMMPALRILLELSKMGLRLMPFCPMMPASTSRWAACPRWRRRPT